MTTALATPGVEDVLAVATEVWSSFLGEDEPLLPAFDPVTPSPDAFHASVMITGGWTGAVALELPAEVATAVARTMLDVADATHEDVVDAVGELANMVGGNIKSLLPGPSTLSLPQVTEGGRPAFPHASQSCQLDLLWAGQPLRIVVFAASDH